MLFVETFRNIFKIKELRDRVLVTLFLLIVFRLGIHIVLPGVNLQAVEAMQQQVEQSGDDLLTFLMLFSGGAIGNIAVLSLGIMPYITSSIIMSLMAKVNPRLEAIMKEGPAGQRKINQYTRLLTIPIALFQSFAACYGSWGHAAFGGGPPIISGDAGFGTIIMATLGLTAGAVFTMWLGEQITEHGIGNGASVLIMAGIIARLPHIIYTLFTKTQKSELPLEAFVLVLAVYVVMIFAIVFITQSQRRIPVQHAKHWRGQRVTLAQRSYLPLKVNQAGVMPVIFASSLLIIPSLLVKIPWFKGAEEYVTRGTFFYVVFYTSMIFFFSYFWTFLFFPPQDFANNLKEYGSFIPGIRPGQNTAEYLDRILRRITLCGAAFLCVVALLPDLMGGQMHVDRRLTAVVGGTGLLIVVGVCQDVVQKIESYLLLHHYSGFAGEGVAMRARR